MREFKLFEKLLLEPLSSLWETAYRVRRSCYEYGILKKNYFKVPVISVGNITFGGTGKTPTIIWLNQFFEDLGLTSVVLTRGYKGNLEHSSGIIRGGQRFRSNPKHYGDEPLLISRKMTRGGVIVGKKRSDNLKKYFPILKPDVVLLDDGFQHIQLYRSYNIVLFDASLPLSRYHTAPMGYLREGLSALSDADAIIISRADQADETKIEGLVDLLRPFHNTDTPIVKMRYTPVDILDCFDKKIFSIQDLSGQNVIALSAIASPDSFYQLLESCGANIVERISYPDHYFFTQEDVNEILFKCSQQSAIVVTSEKDIVKIRRVSQDPKILYINIKVDFMSGKEELVRGLKKVLNLDL